MEDLEKPTAPRPSQGLLTVPLGKIDLAGIRKRLSEFAAHVGEFVQFGIVREQYPAASTSAGSICVLPRRAADTAAPPMADMRTRATLVLASTRK